MIDFSKLKDDEVAVVITDTETGHVITMNGELFEQDSAGAPYIKFGSLVMARAFADDYVKTQKGIELIILDNKGNVIAVVAAV